MTTKTTEPASSGNAVDADYQQYLRAGLAFSGDSDKAYLRVTAKGSKTEYVLDRWD